MNVPQQIAKQLRDVYAGDNWTGVNLTDTLADVSWQESVTKVHNLNSIAALLFHINYYVHRVLNVLQGSGLYGSDKESFGVMPITGAREWREFVNKALEVVESLAQQIEKLDEATLLEDFTDPKYGSYYLNLQGIIEHAYYHLGQISLIKKILKDPSNAD